jgi:hypothetical protein
LHDDFRARIRQTASELMRVRRLFVGN